MKTLTKKRGKKMKTFNITFVEEVTSQVKIEAETLEEAKEMVDFGNFANDEIIERDHFQITEIYEESEE
jgi:hypothetical protein